MTPPEPILQLVEKFDLHYDSYKAHGYNETQVRREFIDPLFKALGWDIDNTQGYAEQYKDVVHEDAIKVGGVTKAPDYCFRVGGVRKFFLEAKKPAVNLKDDPLPAYQLRRYAWSAKLPLSILTDFEEFIVYDTRVRPTHQDKASMARTFYLRYTDYTERWDEIESIFSRDAILKGSFDKYAESKTKKRGTAEVDDAFLAEIEGWRGMLAKNIALRNPGLSQRELNYAVQMTLDRIIFLRICEDRGIEDYGQLQALLNGTQVYPRLCQLFQRADQRYNSGLFHFHREKDRESAPDTLTLDLGIDDKPLKELFKRLYYPESPYEFSVLSVDILGQVYERFLGNIIVKKGRTYVVEPKPEVRKAGGVYYTPTYIVDYIVKHTVGELLKDKKPGPKGGASKLRILDPACGSGSFLLGAYRCLLDWHLEQYTQDPKRWSKGKNPTIYQHHRGGLRLTTAERKRILINNIYGVDIDPQAVEVTKLSLLLKVLEDENAETLQKQLLLFHERALPDLSSNIKCGNSLIGPDFYEGRQMNLFDNEEVYRINAFDWKAEFAEIMKSGGFDAVIGNPPYVDIKGMPGQDVQYIFNNYLYANNRINLFSCFIEKCFHILKPGLSRFSMIVPTALLAQDSYKEIRKWILDKHSVLNLVRLPNESFGSSAGDVKVDTVIFVFGVSSSEQDHVKVIAYSGYNRITNIDGNYANVCGKIDYKIWSDDNDCVWALNITKDEEQILRKCERNSVLLESLVDFSLGITPYDKYKGHTVDQITNKVFHASFKKNSTFKRLLAGNDVGRYWINWNGEKWISYGPWLGAPREQRFFTQQRIVVKQIIDWTSRRIWASFTEEELYNTQNAFNLLLKPANQLSLKFILGIINCRLLTFYHRKRFLEEFKMRFQKILIKDCRRFPIKEIYLSLTEDKSRHDQIVSLVERMLELNQKLQKAKTDPERTHLQRQIDATDSQIDRLVYDLYGLTEEEIAIVEQR